MLLRASELFSSLTIGRYPALRIDDDGSTPIYLLRGRVRFLNSAGKGQQTPFSLILLTLGATREQKGRYAELVPGFWLARGRSAAA